MRENEQNDKKTGKKTKQSKQSLRAIAIANGNGLQEKRKVGAKSLYDEFAVVKVEELAANGFNNTQIAQSLGIGLKTLYDWIDKYPQISHAIKKYRGLADIEVENALYKSAIGFSVTEVEREGRKDPNNPGQYKLVVTKEIDKTFAPNTAACIFYLKNRMPARYKDKIETEISLGQDIGSLAFAVKRRE